VISDHEDVLDEKKFLMLLISEGWSEPEVTQFWAVMRQNFPSRIRKVFAQPILIEEINHTFLVSNYFSTFS
jgi:hypothetical protein